MTPLFLSLSLFLGALPEQLELVFERAPDGCALEERLPQSMARYVPRLELGAGSWKLTVVSRAREVELALVDEEGVERLVRALPAKPDACAAVADGIGLILERYLSDLGYQTGFAPLPEPPASPPPPPVAPPLPPPVAPPPPPPVAPPPPPPPIEPTTTTTPTVAAPPATPLAISLDVGLAGLLEAPSASTVRGGGALDVGLSLGALRIEASVFALAPGAVATADGTYRVWSLGALLRAGACLDLAPVSLCGLVAGGPERVSARITGASLFTQNDAVKLGVLIGGGVRADVELGPILLRFRGETLVRPDRARFDIDETVGFRDQRVAAFLGGGVAVKLF